MSNEVDRSHRARIATDKLKAAADAEALELGPQIVGAFQGLAEEIRHQRAVTERMIESLANVTGVLDRLEMTTRGLAHEMAALRMQRSTNQNGHAPDDTLDHNDTD